LLRERIEVGGAELMLVADSLNAGFAFGDLQSQLLDLEARLVGDFAPELEELQFLEHPFEMGDMHGPAPMRVNGGW
jgi:hypothetical protein